MEQNLAQRSDKRPGDCKARERLTAVWHKARSILLQQSLRMIPDHQILSDHLEVLGAKSVYLFVQFLG